MSSFTPMMEQYFKIKDKYKDCILFYRLGDFYEMFFDDAITASRELELTLTGRDCGQPERAPMCGVPFHSADSYIARLVEKGYKVAICEQTEDPYLAKGLVKRDVVRVVTPGTLMDEGALDSSKNNFLAALCLGDGAAGLAFVDISTGEMYATELTEDIMGHLAGELLRFSPAEALLSVEAYEDGNITKLINSITDCYISRDVGMRFEQGSAIAAIKRHFKVDDAGQIVPEGFANGARAVGAVLQYLHDTQKTDIGHIASVNFYSAGQFMELDASTRRNLELTETMRDKTKKGSLLWVLDKTITSMGARQIRKWVEQPLLNCSLIQRRLSAVEELVSDVRARMDLRAALAGVLDMERLLAKAVYGTANARDLYALGQSLGKLPQIRQSIENCKSGLICEQVSKMDLLKDIRQLIEMGIKDNPPFSVRDGGLIKEGYSEQLDALRRAMTQGKEWLAELEASEREATGIKNLKVGFNKVFGYYIEISKSNVSKVPDYYTRKQTLANGERYITPRLKEIENAVLGAEERIVQLEYQLFTEMREKVAAERERIQRTARAVAVMDCLASLAEVAAKNNYCKPEVDVSDKIVIKDGRHPVVELMLKDTMFVPNDTYLDCGKNRLAIITGPNMAGKSTYMRQTALIALMAQIGSFVPASSCQIGLVDRIFTRVGASDDLAAGQSTFMVEMSEVAYILEHATSKSLLILDEIGRGTSTYDGLSIAWAVLEYAADRKKLGAKTLFATHYHELTELENKLEGVKNYCVSVKKRGDDITFLRRIIPGGADDSYGIEVAKLAGVPDIVIRRAKEILKQIEALDVNRGAQVSAKGEKKSHDDGQGQLGFVSLAGEELVQELKRLDLNTITPIEAFNLLLKLKSKAVTAGQ